MSHSAHLPAGGIEGISTTAGPATGPLGVLIVDDEEGVRCVLGAGLWHHGFAVWLAADAREAVETYRSHRAYIGVALLDVCMPGRDGPGTLAALREVDPRVRCCFMTGDPGRYTQQDLLDLGAVAVLRKPFDLGELAHRLRGLALPAARDGTGPDDRRDDEGGPG